MAPQTRPDYLHGLVEAVDNITIFVRNKIGKNPIGFWKIEIFCAAKISDKMTAQVQTLGKNPARSYKMLNLGMI